MSPSASTSSTGPKRNNLSITASAFTFSLDTPPTKRSRPLGTSTGLPPLPPTPKSSHTLEPRLLTETPKRKVTNVDPLPSPFLFGGIKSTAQSGLPKGKATHRLNDLLDEISPFRAGTGTREEETEEEKKDGDDKPGIRLGDLPGRMMTEDVGRRVKVMVEEDEGIGVSPRRVRTRLKWSGKG